MAAVQYPRWRYHATKPDTLVNSEREEKALGGGWFDNPAQARPRKDELSPQDQIDQANAKAQKEQAEADAKARASSVPQAVNSPNPLTPQPAPPKPAVPGPVPVK